jgi:hypothetical protein
VLLIALPAAAFQTELRQAATDISKEIQAANCHRVVVTEFTDLDGDVTRVGRLLAQELSVALVEVAPEIEVVDRQQVERLMEEIGFTKKGLTNPETAKQLGHMLGADAFVFGTAVSLAKSALLSIRVLEVESTRNVAAKSLELPMTSELQVLFYGRAETAATDPGQPFQVEEYGDFEYRIFPCRRKARRITCELEVVSWKRQMTFVLQGEVRALDPRGTEHELWYLSASQGKSGFGDSLRADLIEGIPLRLTLIFEGVSPEVSKITLDLHSQPKPIQIKDIPVVD